MQKLRNFFFSSNNKTKHTKSNSNINNLPSAESVNDIYKRNNININLINDSNHKRTTSVFDLESSKLQSHSVNNNQYSKNKEKSNKQKAFRTKEIKENNYYTISSESNFLEKESKDANDYSNSEISIFKKRDEYLIEDKNDDVLIHITNNNKNDHNISNDKFYTNNTNDLYLVSSNRLSNDQMNKSTILYDKNNNDNDNSNSKIFILNSNKLTTTDVTNEKSKMSNEKFDFNSNSKSASKDVKYYFPSNNTSQFNSNLLHKNEYSAKIKEKRQRRMSKMNKEIDNLSLSSSKNNNDIDYKDTKNSNSNEIKFKLPLLSNLQRNHILNQKEIYSHSPSKNNVKAFSYNSVKLEDPDGDAVSSLNQQYNNFNNNKENNKLSNNKNNNATNNLKYNTANLSNKKSRNITNTITQKLQDNRIFNILLSDDKSKNSMIIPKQLSEINKKNQSSSQLIKVTSNNNDIEEDDFMESIDNLEYLSTLKSKKKNTTIRIKPRTLRLKTQKQKELIFEKSLNLKISNNSQSKEFPIKNNNENKSNSNKDIVDINDYNKDNNANKDFNRDNSSMSVTTKTNIHHIQKRKLYSFRNVYDSLSDDENDFSIIQNWYNIHPDSVFYKTWLFFYEITILFSVVYFPLLLINEDLLNWDSLLIELITDIILFFEIIICCITGFREKDKINYNSYKILLNYLANSLILDIITSFPHSIIIIIMKVILPEEQEVSLNTYREVSIYFKCLRFLHTFHWLKMPSTKEEDFYSDSKKNDNYVRNKKKKKDQQSFSTSAEQQSEIFMIVVKRILVLFILFFLITHIFACFWIFLGHSQFKNIGMSWLYQNNLIDENTIKIYVASFYFNLVTIFSIGYGDITPTTINEYSYILFFLFISVVVNSFFISFLSSLFQQLDDQEDLSKQYTLVDEICEEYGIEITMRRKLMDSVTNNDYSKKKKKEDLIGNLPKHTQNALFLGMYERKLVGIKFFSKASDEFIRFVVPLINFRIFYKEDVIVNYGQVVEFFYMISSGKLDVELDFTYSFFSIAKVHKGFHYGDLQMFSNTSSLINLRVNSSKADIFYLCKKDLKDIQINFPEHSKKVLKISLYINKLIQRRRSLAIKYYEKHGFLDKGFRQSLMKEFQETMKTQFDMNDKRASSRLNGKNSEKGSIKGLNNSKKNSISSKRSCNDLLLNSAKKGEDNSVSNRSSIGSSNYNINIKHNNKTSVDEKYGNNNIFNFTIQEENDENENVSYISKDNNNSYFMFSNTKINHNEDLKDKNHTQFDINSFKKNSSFRLDSQIKSDNIVKSKIKKIFSNSRNSKSSLIDITLEPKNKTYNLYYKNKSKNKTYSKTSNKKIKFRCDSEIPDTITNKKKYNIIIRKDIAYHKTFKEEVEPLYKESSNFIFKHSKTMTNPYFTISRNKQSYRFFKEDTCNFIKYYTQLNKAHDSNYYLELNKVKVNSNSNTIINSLFLNKIKYKESYDISSTSLFKLLKTKTKNKGTLNTINSSSNSKANKIRIKNILKKSVKISNIDRISSLEMKLIRYFNPTPTNSNINSNKNISTNIKSTSFNKKQNNGAGADNNRKINNASINNILKYKSFNNKSEKVIKHDYKKSKTKYDKHHNQDDSSDLKDNSYYDCIDKNNLNLSDKFKNSNIDKSDLNISRIKSNTSNKLSKFSNNNKTVIIPSTKLDSYNNAYNTNNASTNKINKRGTLLNSSQYKHKNIVVKKKTEIIDNKLNTNVNNLTVISNNSIEAENKLNSLYHKSYTNKKNNDLNLMFNSHSQDSKVFNKTNTSKVTNTASTTNNPRHSNFQNNFSEFYKKYTTLNNLTQEDFNKLRNKTHSNTKTSNYDLINSLEKLNLDKEENEENYANKVHNHIINYDFLNEENLVKNMVKDLLQKSSLFKRKDSKKITKKNAKPNIPLPSKVNTNTNTNNNTNTNIISNISNNNI